MGILYTVEYSTNSYDIITLCWSDLSTDRPNFTDLHTTFDDLLERESGYLGLNHQMIEESNTHLEEEECKKSPHKENT